MLLHCLSERHGTRTTVPFHADLFGADTGTVVPCSDLAHESMYLCCSGASEIEVDPDSGPTSARLRVQFIREHPELLQTFAANLLPQMLQVYNGSVVSQVRLTLNPPLVSALPCPIFSQWNWEATWGSEYPGSHKHIAHGCLTGTARL